MKAVPFLFLAAASFSKASYWLDGIKHQGISPFNPDTSYSVYRNVMGYGAKGDGVTDDTNAINAAIRAGNRCGGKGGCVGSTKTPAVVYFPAGTYIITSPIIDYYYTQIIGDPNDMPIIKAAPTFPSGALGLLDGDEYTNNGKLEFRSTNVFYRQIRNLVFDTRAVKGEVHAIHWPVAQATSVHNCVFDLSTSQNDNHTGIYMEEGSGGIMTDLVFNGGMFGGQFGSQQFTMRNLSFFNTHTGIRQIWNWGWLYKSLSFCNCHIGIDLSSTEVASVNLIDSNFTNVEIAVISGRNDTSGRGSFNTDNVYHENVKTVLAKPDGTPLLLGNPTGKVYDGGSARGNLYAPYGPVDYAGNDPSYFTRPHPLLDGNDKYLEMSKPQYETWDASRILSARDFGAVGDGKTDDTAALNRLFKASVLNSTVAFLDAGYYRVTDAVIIHGGAKIVGEGLAAVIMGAGAKFSDINNPYPVVQIGDRGEVGMVEVSDLIVSTQGAAAGAVLIEYNLKSTTPSSQPNNLTEISCTKEDSAAGASVPSGLWDVHTRIGGYEGSELQVAQCPTTPSQTNYVNPSCIAAYMSMHITPGSGNLYMENNWLWTADHDIDDWNATQVSVFAGRGLLIEGANKVWVVGSAVEHHTLYQYQLVNSSNIFIGYAQTETPYYQPNPPAPAPFSKLNTELFDPDFAFDCSSTSYFNETYTNGSISKVLPGNPPCAMAWGMRMLGSSNVVVWGMGLYSFFNNYNTTCSNVSVGENCQARIFWIGPAIQDRSEQDGQDLLRNMTGPLNNTEFLSTTIYNLATVGSVSMITRLGSDVAVWFPNMATFAAALGLFRF